MHSCVSRIMLTRSAGGQSCRGKNQSPVAWIAGWRETDTLKPIDKTIKRMIASHQAVAKANAEVAPKVNDPRGRASNCRAKAESWHRRLVEAMELSGGVEATA